MSPRALTPGTWPQRGSAVTMKIVAQPDSSGNPTTEQSSLIEAIFQRCHEHTPYPPAGDYYGSFDRASDSLEAHINCPICRNVWTVEFPDIEMMASMASRYGHALSFEPSDDIAWVLTCPRCIINRGNPRAQYADYLQSPHWKTTRAAAIVRAGGRCQVCNATGTLHVHHRSYLNKGHEQPGDLTVLCENCHRLFHEHGRLAS